MDAEPGSSEGEELDILAQISLSTMRKRLLPMGYPSPLAAIQFRMEQSRPHSAGSDPVSGQPLQSVRGAVGQTPAHHADGAGASCQSRHSGRRPAATTWRRTSLLPWTASMGAVPYCRNDQTRLGRKVYEEDLARKIMRGLIQRRRRTSFTCRVLSQERSSAHERKKRPLRSLKHGAGRSWRWPKHKPSTNGLQVRHSQSGFSPKGCQAELV